MDAPDAMLDELDPLQRDVLTVLHLECSPSMSRTAWQDAVRNAGVTDARSRKLTGEQFKAIIQRIESFGAATRTPNHEYVNARAWLVPTLEDAHRRGRLQEFSRSLELANRYSHYTGARRRLLTALATGDGRAVETQLDQYKYQTRFDAPGTSLVRLIGLAAPAAWIAILSPAPRLAYVTEALASAFVSALRVGRGVRDAALASESAELHARVALLDALAGDGAAARASLGGESAIAEISATPPGGRDARWTRAALGFLALTEGRFDDARAAFAAAAAGQRGKRVELTDVFAVLDLFLAVTSDRAEDVADVERRMLKNKRELAPFFPALVAIDALLEHRRSGTSVLRPEPPTCWIEALVIALAERWMRLPPQVGGRLDAAATAARNSGYAWLADELDAIGRGEPRLARLFGTKEPWELALESLHATAQAAKETPSPSPTKAKKSADVWWTVEVDELGLSLEASLASKREVKGTRLSMARILAADATFDESDRRIARRVELSGRSFRLPSAVLLDLAGHPRVRTATGTQVRIESREPRLSVERLRQGARLRILPEPTEEDGSSIELLTDEPDLVRIVVYKPTPLVTRVRASIPPGGLLVPAAGAARLSAIVAELSSEIGVDADAALEDAGEPGDPRVHVQMFRTGSALRARLRVVPGGASGPALRPGSPPSAVVIDKGGSLARVTRDLAEETRRLTELLERCPMLSSLPREGDDLVARELETCLELLIELREAEADVVIEWLEGTPLRAPLVRDSKQVRVRVSGDTSWLSVNGEVTVDDGRVVQMTELLEAASRAKGRFVPIGDDAYVALTDELRKKLDALTKVTSLGKGGRVPGAALVALDGVLDGMDVSFSKELATRRDALERARDLAVPVPRDLAAELRDYQREGFLFLARRTEAGLGACLADDMGLGKTVQALALLLHRRKRGPALVVAPTSVVRNWEDEARKFAPALNVTRLADDAERAAAVAAAKKGDVVLVSYGLLASAEEVLASREWATVIYDEAHALKNATTRRWAAARAIRADAVVALSGTPVENHAGELHALFELLVPGMLGARAAYERAIAAPIAAGDREASALLRRLVRPLVLRRTKTEVLTELPPKTEVLHAVAPSAEHLAFYEAVRRRAIDKMDAARRAGGAAAARSRIDLLAEITRLRRAAIDPRLVGGDEAPAGSKIDALVELVDELRTERRRALVFSQFLEVLDLARAGLEARGCECLRFDGTMSEAARADVVASFQAGAADVLLVSLKAGGVGMNLTAADVVILLDPWWNPAVEDQAAGRAHRIGQTRPVTVARIVTERTIEEKVIALHAKKRALYDDVIADADGAGTFELETLGALLAEA